MSSFTSLLSSINGRPSETTKSASTPHVRTPSTVAVAPHVSTDKSRLVPNNAAAGIKRRADEPTVVANLKSMKLATDKEPPRPLSTLANDTSARPALTTTYRGTARAPVHAGSMSRPMSKPISKPAAAPISLRPNTATTDATAKPKRGFASVMEKAKAAQEAAKAQGPSGIKHKPVEKLSRREKTRMQEEAAAVSSKAKALNNKRERGKLPSTESRSILQKKAAETSYKGTMKKQANPLSYKGTMNAKPAANPVAKKPAQKNLGQDKYGGYASWSDLDEAEDEEEEEDYESDASSDMEGGFDDVEREETEALKFARKEDQAALEEEERLKREKLERKRKLLELSKSAAAKKRY